MDTLTLRIAFGVVAACVLVLCYGVTYRATRSAYSRWWCLSLGAFICASTLWLFSGTSAQALASPAGNVAGVLGGGFVWAGASSLRGRSLSWWRLGLVPAVVGPASALEHPGRDPWAGGSFYLAGMAVLIGLSAVELGLALRSERRSQLRASYRFALASMLVVSTVISAFYAARTVVFVAAGPHNRVFEVAFGSQATTLLTLVLLVVATFSMSALSHEQRALELREQATRDGMTGLVNRTEFLRLAQAEIDAGGPDRTSAVLAVDLDRFKELNDGYGHDAGDEALLVFAEVCAQTVGRDGVVGRLGGDEFAILLHDDALAEQIAEDIAVRLAAAPGPLEGPAAMPSASFGIARVGATDEASAVVTQADIALYQAKAAGRACAVRFDGRLPEPTQTYGARNSSSRPGVAASASSTAASAGTSYTPT